MIHISVPPWKPVTLPLLEEVSVTVIKPVSIVLKEKAGISFRVPPSVLCHRIPGACPKEWKQKKAIRRVENIFFIDSVLVFI